MQETVKLMRVHRIVPARVQCRALEPRQVRGGGRRIQVLGVLEHRTVAIDESGRPSVESSRVVYDQSP